MPYHKYSDNQENINRFLTKFSPFMDLYGSSIFSPYEIIYFFISYDYIETRKGDYNSPLYLQLKYIYYEINDLSEEEKKNICLLILKKITQDYFVKITTYKSGPEFEIVKENIHTLILILYTMGDKYKNTIRYLKKLITGFIQNKTINMNQSYNETIINQYLDFIRYSFYSKRFRNSSIPDNANSSYSIKYKQMNCLQFPCIPTKNTRYKYLSGNYSSRYSSKSSSGNSSGYSSKPSSENSSIRLNTNRFKNLIEKIGLDYTKVNLSNKTYGNKTLSSAIKKTLLEVHSNKRNSKTVFSETNSNKLRKRIEYVKELENILSSSGEKRKGHRNNNNNRDSYSKRGRGNNNN
jgi:hypothetical protein